MIANNVINKAILKLFTITASSKIVSDSADNSFIISSQKIVNVWTSAAISHLNSKQKVVWRQKLLCITNLSYGL